MQKSVVRLETDMQNSRQQAGGTFRRASLFFEKNASVPLHKRNSFYVFVAFFILGSIASIAFTGRHIVESAKALPVAPTKEEYKLQFPTWFYEDCKDKEFGCTPETKEPTVSPTNYPTNLPTSAPTTSPTKRPTPSPSPVIV